MQELTKMLSSLKEMDWISFHNYNWFFPLEYPNEFGMERSNWDYDKCNLVYTFGIGVWFPDVADISCRIE